MNRIANFLDAPAKQFAAEARDLLRSRAGLCKHDVFQLLAGWNQDRELWEISLRLTPKLWWQVGSPDEETALELFRELMLDVRRRAREEGMLQ